MIQILKHALSDESAIIASQIPVYIIPGTPRCPLFYQHNLRACMAASPASSAAASMPARNSSITHKDFRQRKPSDVAVAFQQQQLAPPTLTIRPSTRPVPTEAKNGCLASAWREIHGANDWSGLVEPLDPLLREEVVRYGELVMACYKAFDVDPSSNRYLKCKYGRHRLMNEVGLSAAGYEITRYIYATPGVSLLSSPAARGGRWIGYVAVSSSSSSLRLGRRDILVAFRGTVTAAEWAANIMSNLAPAGLDPLDPRPDVKVESGFLSLYTSADPAAARFGHGSCREQLLSEISRLVNRHEGEGEATSITVAGHSMGSALAMLFGYDLAELGLSRAAPVAVYSFGGPRVGNAGFKGRMEELGVKVLRVVNVWDLVTKLPGLWKVGVPWSGADEGERYEHVGVELALDFVELREFPTCVHDLGTYIQLLSVAAKGRAAARSRFPGWGWVDIVALRMVGDWVTRSLRLLI